MLQSAITMSQTHQAASRPAEDNRPARAAQGSNETDAETPSGFDAELSNADLLQKQIVQKQLAQKQSIQSQTAQSQTAQSQTAQGDSSLSSPLADQLTDQLADPIVGDAAVADEKAQQEARHETTGQLENDSAAEQWILQMLGQQTAQLQARDLNQSASANSAELQANLSLSATANNAEKNLESTAQLDQRALLMLNQSAAQSKQNQSQFQTQSQQNQSQLQTQSQTQPAFINTDAADKNVDPTAAIGNNSDLPSDLLQRGSAYAPANTPTTNERPVDSAIEQPKNAVAALMIDRLHGVAPAQGQDSATSSANQLLNQTLSDAVPERSFKLQGSEAKWGEQMLHALRENVSMQLQHRQQNATIRLDPPELGSMEIFLSHESGRLNIQISASQTDVARLVQQTSDRLRQELVNQQFVQVNVQVSSDNQGGQRHSQQRSAQWNEEQITQNHQGTGTASSGKNSSHNDILVTV